MASAARRVQFPRQSAATAGARATQAKRGLALAPKPAEPRRRTNCRRDGGWKDAGVGGCPSGGQARTSTARAPTPHHPGRSLRSRPTTPCRRGGQRPAGEEAGDGRCACPRGRSAPHRGRPAARAGGCWRRGAQWLHGAGGWLVQHRSAPRRKVGAGNTGLHEGGDLGAAEAHRPAEPHRAQVAGAAKPVQGRPRKLGQL